MKKVVINRLEEFGAAGYGTKIKPYNLSKMATKYKSNNL